MPRVKRSTADGATTRELGGGALATDHFDRSGGRRGTTVERVPQDVARIIADVSQHQRAMVASGSVIVGLKRR